MKAGLQLYGVLKDQKEHTLKMLKQLSEERVIRIEPCVSMEPIPGFEQVIWALEWLEEQFPSIRDCGLEIRSCHVFAKDLLKSAGRLGKLAEEYGIRQFVVKSPADLQKEVLRRTAREYAEAARILNKSGARLLIHNEAMDISVKINGQTAYEVLLDECGGHVQAQVDIGWVYYAGEDPLAFLERNRDRAASIHFKDFRMNGTEMEETVVGTGEVDSLACYQFGREHGCDMTLDMDDFSFQALRQSAGLFQTWEETFG